MPPTFVSRQEWGAKPPRAVTKRPPSQLSGVAVHWFGSPRAAKSHEGCAELLRSVQRTHMAPGGLGTKHGAADIAYCVDIETEALTTDGWKRYDALREGDLVVTLDHETGEAEWQPVEAVNVFPARRRELVAIDAAGHSSLTTPEHRWPVERYRRRTGRERVRGADGRFAPAAGRAPAATLERRLATRERLFATSGTLTCWDRITTAATVRNLPDVPVYDDDFVELVAWAWTEGRVARSRGRLTTGLTLYRSHVVNPELVARIRGCLSALYGPPRETLRQPTSRPAWREYRNGRKTEFRLNRVAGAQVLEVMTSPGKIVSSRFIASLTASQLRRFVEVSVLADGFRQGPTLIVTQSVERRLDALEMAAALLGLRTRRFVQAERDGDARHGLRISESERARSFWPHRAGPRRVEHDGVVWCPTTPNGTWLARRRGTVYFTGNSHAVCPHGHAFTLRGFGVQTGANGDAASNRDYAAVVYMGGTGDTPTAEGLATLAAVIREWQAQGAGPLVKPHGFFTGSECPGPDIGKWLRKLPAPWLEEGAAPVVQPTVENETPGWLLDFVVWRLALAGDPKRRPKGVPDPVPESAWEAVARMERTANLMGPQQSFLDWAEWRRHGAQKDERPRSLPAKIPDPWWEALKRLEAIFRGERTLAVAETPEQNEDTPKEEQPPEEPAADTGPVTADSALLAEPRATKKALEAHVLGRKHGSYGAGEVKAILKAYVDTAKEVGLDPLLVVAQMVLETGNLTSHWSQPPRRNPAGIGVTGEPGKGVSFPSWDDAVRAHVGRLLAYALPKGQETAAQRKLIEEALGWRPLPDNRRGVAPTLAGLAGTWAMDPKYAGKLVRVANEIRAAG